MTITIMNLKTKKLIVMMALFAFSVTTLYAQRVEATLVEGMPVINCTGMPATAITTTTKGTTRPELDTFEADLTVYHRFAVAVVDASPSSIWVDAFTHCAVGGGWRLPTGRELMLMWVLKEELERASGFTKFTADYYWSAKNSRGNPWYVNFASGETRAAIPPPYSRVRCVKEL